MKKNIFFVAFFLSFLIYGSASAQLFFAEAILRCQADFEQCDKSCFYPCELPEGCSLSDFEKCLCEKVKSYDQNTQCTTMSLDTLKNILLNTPNWEAGGINYTLDDLENTMSQIYNAGVTSTNRLIDFGFPAIVDDDAVIKDEVDVGRYVYTYNGYRIITDIYDKVADMHYSALWFQKNLTFVDKNDGTLKRINKGDSENHYYFMDGDTVYTYSTDPSDYDPELPTSSPNYKTFQIGERTYYRADGDLKEDIQNYPNLYDFVIEYARRGERFNETTGQYEKTTINVERK